jgi:hypothetical protein|nr:MAG TPA: hypothetical protein [Caudoviricetes sp.]
MAKKKKNLVDKVKEAFSKEVKEEVEVVDEVEELEPELRSADFGIPAEDEELVVLEDEE